MNRSSVKNAVMWPLALAACLLVSPLKAQTPSTIWAWGAGGGALGTANVSSTMLPVSTLNSSKYLHGMIDISCGDAHSLMLKEDGTVWASGNGVALGDGTSLKRMIAVQVKGVNNMGFLADIQAISAGNNSSMALKTDGTVWTWGLNSNGQLGDGTRNMRVTPVQVKGPEGIDYLTDIAAISSGRNYCLALKTDGTVWAWGQNTYGELGSGTQSYRTLPVQVRGQNGTGFLTDIVAISAGGFSLALKSDGTVWAWGRNTYGQIGDDTTTNRRYPVQVKGSDGVGFLTNVTTISCGYSYSLVRRADGTVWGWGRNHYGQLGNGNLVDQATPVQVRGQEGNEFLIDVVAFDCGNTHSVALTANGMVLAWGNNEHGRLGDGTTANRSTPAPVVSPNGSGLLVDILTVSANNDHNVVLRNDGTVWTWGRNSNGELSDGSYTTRLLPSQALGVSDLSISKDVISIVACNGYSLALKADGTVWSWGLIRSGSLEITRLHYAQHQYKYQGQMGLTG